MQIKTLEIRDVATSIAAFAFSVTPDNAEQRYLLCKAGYGTDSDLIVLGFLNGRRPACYSPYDWNDRTMTIAHRFIEENWDSLKDGDVVDVEFILGETTEKKISERFGG